MREHLQSTGIPTNSQSVWRWPSELGRLPERSPRSESSEGPTLPSGGVSVGCSATPCASFQGIGGKTLRTDEHCYYYWATSRAESEHRRDRSSSRQRESACVGIRRHKRGLFRVPRLSQRPIPDGAIEGVRGRARE